MDARVNNIGRPLQVRRHMNGLAGQILRVLAPTLLGLLALLPDAVGAEVLFPPKLKPTSLVTIQMNFQQNHALVDIGLP